MRMQVILDSSFARPGSAPIWGGKKGEFRDWTIDHQACFHILVTPWQLREAIYHFFPRTLFQLRISRILFAGKTSLGGSTHGQTIICKQLFADHVVGSRQWKGRKQKHRMIINIKVKVKSDHRIKFSNLNNWTEEA